MTGLLRQSPRAVGSRILPWGVAVSLVCGVASACVGGEPFQSDEPSQGGSSGGGGAPAEEGGSGGRSGSGGGPSTSGGAGPIGEAGTGNLGGDAGAGGGDPEAGGAGAAPPTTGGSGGGSGGGGANGGAMGCSADFADCNNRASDGCETSLDSAANCGRCGNDCSGPNATAACVSRQCAPLSCSAGFADCNGNRVDGCEATLDLDARCGDCARKCLSPTPFCASSGATRSCTNPMQKLIDQRIELPCVEAVTATNLCATIANQATACTDAGKVVTRSLTMGGRAGVTYNVSLRIRGVLEPKIYAGGRGPGDHFYIGGTPTETNYNSYSLKVSAPAQTYYLNYDEAAGESRMVFTLDHTKVIQVAGGATIQLQVSDPDCASVKNCKSFETTTCDPYVVAGIPPAPDGFNGQFVHFDVVGVENAN